MQRLVPIDDRSAHNPLRHSFRPDAGQSAPIASSPATSPPESASGGVQTGTDEPNEF